MVRAIVLLSYEAESNEAALAIAHALEAPALALYSFDVMDAADVTPDAVEQAGTLSATAMRRALFPEDMARRIAEAKARVADMNAGIPVGTE